VRESGKFEVLNRRVFK